MKQQSHSVRERETEKAECYLMDIQREYYEVTQPQLQNSPMLSLSFLFSKHLASSLTTYSKTLCSFSRSCVLQSLLLSSLLSVQIGHLGQSQLLREDLHVVLAL